MTFKRLWQSFRLMTIRGAAARTKYIRKQHIYGAIGDNCTIQGRILPLYANLIRIGNNVHIASNVAFLTHDVSHLVLKSLPEISAVEGIQERIGCIEIGDNVFLGSGTCILYDTKIGNNVVIGTRSVVTHDIPDNSVVAVVPARVIGTFDDYVKKFIENETYPKELKPKRQTVSPELAELMWARFDEKHQ